jgi:aminoglycoside 6'-N-acetyltransferase I
MRIALWPSLSASENTRECEELVSQNDRFSIFVSEEGERLTGFIEVGLRLYAEGCETSPVGYIEGWYVAPERRKTGTGRELVKVAEEWARLRGCSEMASDSILENVEGQQAHIRLGYTEVERQVCFRKSLI